jgi:hypothetical protein
MASLDAMSLALIVVTTVASVALVVGLLRAVCWWPERRRIQRLRAASSIGEREPRPRQRAGDRGCTGGSSPIPHPVPPTITKPSSVPSHDHDRATAPATHNVDQPMSTPTCASPPPQTTNPLSLDRRNPGAAMLGSASALTGRVTL